QKITSCPLSHAPRNSSYFDKENIVSRYVLLQFRKKVATQYREVVLRKRYMLRMVSSSLHDTMAHLQYSRIMPREMDAWSHQPDRTQSGVTALIQTRPSNSEMRKQLPRTAQWQTISPMWLNKLTCVQIAEMDL
ncbi:hypothetical protein AVEN_24296-1, partial [Araneus ventricosus]